MSCLIEPTVQKDDFDDSLLGGVISRKPLLAKSLRKFKHFDRQLGRFVVRTIEYTGSLTPLTKTRHDLRSDPQRSACDELGGQASYLPESPLKCVEKPQQRPREVVITSE
jgi:hypothetical protein